MYVIETHLFLSIVPISDKPFSIIERITTGNVRDSDFDVIRQILIIKNPQNVAQLGKCNINLAQGCGDIHIGDHIYQGADTNAIREILRSLLQELQNSNSQTNPETDSEVKPTQTVCQLNEALQQYLENTLQLLRRLHSPKIHHGLCELENRQTGEETSRYLVTTPKPDASS